MINEDTEYRLKRDVEKVSLRLIMDPESHVPDTLTRIRVLSSVAVVGQLEKVQRSGAKNTILDCYVKFLPTSADDYKNLTSLGKLIKALPGVKIVRVLTFNDKRIMHDNRPIVI